MLESFEEALAFVLAQEGGFAELKGDETTNLGVKKSTWENYIGRVVTKDDIRALKVVDVKPLYKKEYYDRAYCHQLFTPMDLCVFDFAVHSGCRQALTTLARTIGIPYNSKLVKELVAKVNAFSDKKKLVSDYIDARLKFLQGLKNFKDFGRGWTNRITRLRKKSQMMS